MDTRPFGYVDIGINPNDVGAFPRMEISEDTTEVDVFDIARTNSGGDVRAFFNDPDRLG